MYETNYLISTILILSGIVILNIAFFAIRKRDTSGAFPFALLLIAASFHTIGYAFEILSTDVDSMMFWIKVEYIGCSFYSFLSIYFAREYTDEKIYANTKVLYLFLAINITTLILVFTNQYHHIFYGSLTIDNSFLFPVLASEKSIWYIVHIAFIFISYIYLIVVFTRQILITKSNYRYRASIMLIGSLVTIFFSLIYLFNLGPKYIDIIPFAMVISSIIFAIGLFGFNILNLVPITYQHIFNNIEEGVILLDNDLRLVNSNPPAKQLLPKINKYAKGNNIKQLIRHYKIDLTKDNEEQIIHMNINKMKKIYNIKSSVITNAKFFNIGIMVVIKDITEEQQAFTSLSELATIDTLTCIYNRRYFFELCEIYFQDNKLTDDKYLLLLDIDHFKKINDNYGHQTGDIVLKKFGQILNETFKSYGFVGRYGGEEFIVLLNNISSKDAIAKAEYFRNLVSKTTIYEDEINITVSIGLHYSYGESLNEAIKKADDLLYKAKNNNRNRIEYE